MYGLGPLYVIQADGTTRALARDGSKSVRAEVNGSGAVTASFRYRAYGEISQWSGASVPTVLGYAGQLLDPSGLYYLRARWYDPATGRFVSRDPLIGELTLPASLNSFGYGAANPLVFADPSGEGCAAYPTQHSQPKGLGGAPATLSDHHGGRDRIPGDRTEVKEEGKLILTRAHRILKRLESYDDLSSSGVAPEEVGALPGENVVGAYRNGPSLRQCLFVTTRGVRYFRAGRWQLLDYADIDRAPLRSKDDRAVEIQLKDGREVRLPVVGGEGRLRDALEVLRFLNRVAEDLSRVRRARS